MTAKLGINQQRILSTPANGYAKIVLEQLLESTKLLEDNPHLGKKEPLLAHKKAEYRFLVKWSYKIIYRVDKKVVVISRLFHTSRNPRKLKGV